MISVPLLPNYYLITTSITTSKISHNTISIREGSKVVIKLYQKYTKFAVHILNHLRVNCDNYIGICKSILLLPYPSLSTSLKNGSNEEKEAAIGHFWKCSFGDTLFLGIFEVVIQNGELP